MYISPPPTAPPPIGKECGWLLPVLGQVVDEINGDHHLHSLWDVEAAQSACSGAPARDPAVRTLNDSHVNTHALCFPEAECAVWYCITYVKVGLYIRSVSLMTESNTSILVEATIVW